MIKNNQFNPQGTRDLLLAQKLPEWFLLLLPGGPALLCLAMALSLSLSAQNPVAQSTKGTDFWIGFADNFDSWDFSSPVTLRVFITADDSTSGSLEIPGSGWSAGFSVAANSTTAVVVPVADALARNSEVVESRGIHVQADDPVSVYALNHKDVSSDATIVLPTNTLGSRYRAVCYEPSSPSGPSQILIVAVADGTSLRITPSADTEAGVPAGVPIDVELDRGQTFLIESPADLTGSSIENHPTAAECRDFAVFSGALCVNVPSPCGFCDHLYQHLTPVSAWGQRFPVIPFATRGGDLFRVVADRNGTLVDFGSSLVSLDAGEFYDTLIASPGMIYSSFPVAIAQYSLGGTCDGVIDADPFMILLNPDEQTVDRITFNSFSSAIITEYFVNLIIQESDLATATLDGAEIGASAFASVPGSTDLYFVQLSVSPGNHQLSAGSGLSAYVYGFGEFESYGYTAGTNLFTLENAFLVSWGNDTALYYEFQQSIFCNSAVGFQVDSLPGWSFFWDWGDGTYSAGSSVFHSWTEPGDYLVQLVAQGPNQCAADTVTWPISIDGIPHGIPLDTLLCPGQSIVLELEAPGLQVIWPDGSSDPEFLIDVPGEFPVIFSDGICTVQDTLHVQPGTEPLPSWPGSPIVCPDQGTRYMLSPGPHFDLLWDFDNSDANPLTVTEPGEYSVTIWNKEGCLSRSMVEVLEICEINIVAPNVFTPNGDGLHDSFGVLAGNLLDFEMEIFNRWGQVVFRSSDISERWDGTYRGIPQENSTYLWKVNYTDVLDPGSRKTAAGHITILR